MSSPVRRVCYITGTRADFGLMRSTLRRIAADPMLRLELIVTGMHLDALYGATVAEIDAEGWPQRLRLPLALTPATGATMARNIGLMTTAFTDALATDPPDLLLLLGDRGEMLAGAIAAQHLGIAVLHLHGGERSGTVDEPVRHAISRLSHYHGTATEASRQRLLRSGEAPQTVFLTGAPGVDGLTDLASIDRSSLCAEAGLDPARPLALFVFHPVLDEAEQAGDVAAVLLDTLHSAGCQVVALMPNADGGSERIRAELLRRQSTPGLALFTHLTRERFVSWMAAADLMVGNSSAGIIEAASFGTPVLDVGNRQRLRERGPNVRSVEAQAPAFRLALQAALGQARHPQDNPYGDGKAGERIVNLLRMLPVKPHLAAKHHVD